MMEWSKLLNQERRRETSSKGEARSQFERDFDRLIFSTPVRRLQDKAQVFPLEPLDFVRNRLTHSLEVSSVARGLATAVTKWLRDEGIINDNQARDIEVIAATSGLIHDLGNPPFGHSGEASIQYWFEKTFKEDDLKDKLGGDEQRIQDFKKFEGNAQTLRLVAKLQVLADNYGLNLTYGTLSAINKYVSQSNETNREDCSTKKPGYFASENDLIKEIREKTGTGNARNPITFLVAAADDIVYATCDIEDAIKKGVLSWRSLREQLHSDEVFRDSVIPLKMRILSDDPKISDDIQASAFRTAAIMVMTRSISEAFKNNYDEIISGRMKSELYDVCNISKFLKILTDDIGKEKIYCTKPTLKLEIMGRLIINDLMDILWEGIEHYPTGVGAKPKPKDFIGKINALISPNYCEVMQYAIGENPGLEYYYRFQLLTDYICGMTDSFAKRLHTELMNG